MKKIFYFIIKFYENNIIINIFYYFKEIYLLIYNGDILNIFFIIKNN